MGTRPGHIVRDVLVPIEQPRTIASVRRHPAYTGLREEIWQQLRQSAAEQAGNPVEEAGEA
jgi:ABC-type nitrate/sulfonate/bicarbonate transport system ATPase subunit